jgi:chromosome segregation ATPase
MHNSLQEDLSRARAHIEEIEAENSGLKEDNELLQSQVLQLKREFEEQGREVANLRSLAGVSQQNWVKERDELLSREAYAREEFENAKQAMQDWEMLATEERALRENLGDRVAQLEEQLATQRDAFEKTSSDRDSQSQTVDALQRALRDVQEGNTPAVDVVFISADFSQNGRKSCEKWLSAHKNNSTSYESSFNLRNKQQQRPNRTLRRLEKN